MLESCSQSGILIDEFVGLMDGKQGTEYYVTGISWWITPLTLDASGTWPGRPFVMSVPEVRFGGIEKVKESELHI